MKKAKILINNVFAGILTEDEDGYHFSYLAEYLRMEGAVALAPTMPLQEEEFEKEVMFPVFDGLIPEGWMLDIVDKNWKINPRDRMSLLWACCKDSIGNISVLEFK
jgi:serine/threonine-protein kinase HipA